MSLGIVWAHGWGFDGRFFDPLVGYFPKVHSLFLNREYFGYQESLHKIEALEFLQGSNAIRWIGVGHSLGFFRLLTLPLCGYVSIAGFHRFCSLIPEQSGVSIQSVERMIQAYEHYSHKVLHDFYKKCDFRGKPPEGEHRESLLMDLQRLKTLNAEKLLREIQPPILSLAAINDRIVDQRLSQEFFERQPHGQLIFCNQGGHALGFNEAPWCAKQIKMWIKGYV